MDQLSVEKPCGFNFRRTYQPVTQIAGLLRRPALLIQSIHEQFLSVFNISTQPLHRRHGIRVGSITLFQSMCMLIRFGEYVWVLCGRKDAVKIGLIVASPRL